MNPPLCIGICLGDVTGIGPEVTLKAIAALPPTDATRYLLIGDASHLRRLNDQLGLRLSLADHTAGGLSERISICQPLSEPLSADMSPGDPRAARAALAWLREGAHRCLRHELAALVTAPVNKESIIRAGEKNFVGQTELLSELALTERTAMMLLGHDERGRWLRVVLATNHVPLRRVADELTQKKILRAIELAAQACWDLGLPRARIAVCGLNPHAGEGGKIGDEEIRTISPAIQAAQAKQIEVTGPWAADALFYHVLRGEYDIVVAMYHDQGLGPLKMIGFETGVNWTLGLPFIRTSPDHGTAYDIVGRHRANPSSMTAAIVMAKNLANKRFTKAN